MVRPKKNTAGKSAQERLGDAFWDSLSEAPFAEMTIMGVSKRASVNHNTFYRYYDNLGDMAQKLFDELELDGLPGTLLSVRTLDHVDPDTVSARINPEDLRKVYLFARSGSSYLIDILRETIISKWLELAKVNRESLTYDQNVDIDFIFSGLIAVISHQEKMPNLRRTTSVLDRPLGKGVLETLAALNNTRGTLLESDERDTKLILKSPRAANKG